MNMPPPSELLVLLEELRSIAQLGLHYASGDRYDQARYERLLELSTQTYSKIGQLPKGVLLKRFQRDLGHVTPKVGVNGAILNPQNQLLLVLRRDDHCWSLPAGWCDMNESPRQAIEREFSEELGIQVQAGRMLEVFSRLPGQFGSPHTSYHLLFETSLLNGEPCCDLEEILDWGWFGAEANLSWHLDHQQFAQYVWQFAGHERV